MSKRSYIQELKDGLSLIISQYLDISQYRDISQ